MKSLVQIRHVLPTLVDEAHETCPGHAVYVEAFLEEAGSLEDRSEWVTEDTPVCADPVKYRHLKAARTAGTERVQGDTSVQDRIDEEAREERRRVIENNKQWRAATAVRDNWLKSLLAKKTPPKSALRLVFAELVDPRTHLTYTAERRHETACELLGVEQAPPRWQFSDESDLSKTLMGAIASATDARATVIALALVLGSYESTMNGDVWRRADGSHAAYLSQLVEWGYELRRSSSR